MLTLRPWFSPLFSFLPDKKYMWFISFFQGLTLMSFPASNGLLSACVSEAEQGSVLALSAGIRSLTQGMAPILFNGLFSYFTWDRAFAKFPAAPFVVSSTCIVVALIAATRLPSSEARRARDAAEVERAAQLEEQPTKEVVDAHYSVQV
jgi:MFS family permease